METIVNRLRNFRVPGFSRDDVEQEIRAVVLEHEMMGVIDDQELYNYARQHLHKLRRRRREEPLDTDIAADIETPLFDCIDAFRGLLDSARDKLTETQYEILVLTYLDGMSDDQIAAHLKRSVRTVQARRSESLKILSNILTL